MFSRRFLRIKVIKALYAHFKSDSDSVAVSEKELVKSIDKSYDLYFQMLRLVADVRVYAEERIEIGRRKKLPTPQELNPNTRFIDNRVIRQIEDSEALNDYLARKSLGWGAYPELIKSLYSELTASEYYLKYMSGTDGGYDADRTLTEDFYIETVQNSGLLEEVVEEQSIQWCDDINFALIMVLKTLECSREKQKDLPLRKEFKSEDDLVFTKELFRHAASNFREYLEYIERFTQNWDIDRIAFLDNIILVCAMSELIWFDSIPIKVTLDEYIEISKYYSTPGSSLFINGVLDRIVESLQKEGKINKSGRGLLD